jgi:hypothetical protein
MKRRRTIGKYILDAQGRVVPEHDFSKWATWLETHSETRIVRREWVDNVQVSTLFLGLDHNFSGGGAPVLWETMAFSNRANFDCVTRRCAGNREQAEAMHKQMVQYVQEEIAKTK